MGAVYRGRDPELDRPVAIKVMLHATPDFVAALPPRGAVDRAAGARQHRAGLRLRRRRRRQSLLRDGADRRHAARRAGAHARQAAAARGGAPRQAGGGGAGGRASRRHHPSRRQAVEPHRRRARPPQAGRLRHRAHGVGLAADQRRRAHGHAGLHGARAGGGQEGRCARRHLRARHDAVRAVRGRAGLHRRRSDRAGRHEHAAAAARSAAARHPRFRRSWRR